ncbi:MAG: YncE family protein [Solirubrobacterales bacterium]|nr:YncE family protein [Solirubrobacterales bacterium]
MVSNRSAITPNGRFLYVANAGIPLHNPAIQGSVSVIDLVSNFPNQRITVNVSGNPDAVAVTPDGHEVYVANLDGSVNVIRTDDQRQVAKIPVGGQLTGVAISPSGAFAYVSGSSGVTVINTATRRVITTVKVGDLPSAIAVTPDGRYVYVTNQLSSTVSAIDTTTNQVTVTLGPERPVELAAPVAVAITPDGHFAYVASESAAQDNLAILPVAPFVNQVTPQSLAAGSNVTVAVSGTNLAGATALDFGSNSANSFSCSVSSCTATPPHLRRRWSTRHGHHVLGNKPRHESRLVQL